jgi:hypothetical protein
MSAQFQEEEWRGSSDLKGAVLGSLPPKGMKKVSSSKLPLLRKKRRMVILWTKSIHDNFASNILVFGCRMRGKPHGEVGAEEIVQCFRLYDGFHEAWNNEGETDSTPMARNDSVMLPGSSGVISVQSAAKSTRTYGCVVMGIRCIYAVQPMPIRWRIHHWPQGLAQASIIISE